MLLTGVNIMLDMITADIIISPTVISSYPYSLLLFTFSSFETSLADLFDISAVALGGHIESF